MQGSIIKVSGPLIVAANMTDVKMYDVVKVGEQQLIGEVIELRGDKASVQVYEETSGLGVGDKVVSTGSPLSVELAPGLIGSIFDGIQRPLDKIVEQYGDRITRGIKISSIDREKKWRFNAIKKPGDKVTLNIMRGSEAPKDYEVTMGEQPKTFRKSEFKYFKRLGFSVREYLMDDAVARRKLDNDLNGAVVQFVRDNSPASSALPTPLAAGDLIKEINSEPVKTYAEAVEKLSKINDDESAKELVILSEDARETKVIRIKLD